MENQVTPAPPKVPSEQPPQPMKKGYGKRPLWQWVAIYLIVGAVVYGAIYYFAYAKKGGYSANGNTNSSGYQY